MYGEGGREGGREERRGMQERDGKGEGEGGREVRKRTEEGRLPECINNAVFLVFFTSW